MGRMTRLIDYGAWASSRSDPSKRRTWPLRRAGWRFDRASGAWDGPDGERLTVSFLGFAILEREDADWEHPGTGYGTQWHGGRYGMPYARRVDGDWRPRVAVMLARNAVKVQDLMLSRPLTAVSAADARRLLVRCRRAADLYPPDDPDLFRRLMDGLEERTTRIGSYAMVEHRRGFAGPVLALAGGLLTPVGSFLLGSDPAGLAGIAALAAGLACSGLSSLIDGTERAGGASVLLPFVALALMSPAENWNPRGPKPKTMDEYVGDVWNLDGLAIAEPGYMDPLSGFPRIKGSYRVSWKRNGRRVEGTLGIDGANVELRDNQGMIVSPVNPGTPVWKPGAKHSKG